MSRRAISREDEGLPDKGWSLTPPAPPLVLTSLLMGVL